MYLFSELGTNVDELQITALQLEQRITDVESIASLLQESVSSLLASVSDLENADILTDERVSTLEANSTTTNDRVSDLETLIVSLETNLNDTIDNVNGRFIKIFSKVMGLLVSVSESLRGLRKAI